MKLLFLFIFLSAVVSVAQADIVLRPLVNDGLDKPIGLTHAGDESGRLFFNEQAGRIKIFDQTRKRLLNEPFLDISDRILAGGERGLLGLAFHPEYSRNGLFFVHYSSNGKTCGAGAGDTVISRFKVSGRNPDRAERNSESCILTVKQPYSNHNGGQIAFGPDGYLYIALGDGGSAGDPQNNGQNLKSLLGSLLRIDIDKSSQGRGYAIPADNPFASDNSSRAEIWAWGLRNPWRFSFDRQTGDLWIADVGQDEWEEINFQPAVSRGGENYGWACREGRHEFSRRKPGCPAADPVEPVIEYDHNPECSVTGGYRYRGKISSLSGTYLYGDYCSGTIWGARKIPSGWQPEVLHRGGFGLTSFGEDQAGNLYAIYNNVVFSIKQGM